MSNLLALDQSTRITGYSIFKNGQLIAHGKFELTADDIGARLVALRAKLLELIKEYEINELAFEDIQLQNNVVNNVQTFKMLSEVFGVVQELAEEIKMPYTIVSSNSWKSTMKIPRSRREQEKRAAQALVESLYQLKVSQDEADAICLGAHVVETQKNSWD